MYSFKRDTNDLLNFASYQIVSRHEEITGEPPTGLFFNKALSVLNRELENGNIRLGLPHCWYRWGDEVVRILMPRAIEWVHEDPPRTTVTWKLDPPETSQGIPIYDRIADRVSALISDYAVEGGLERLVDYVYSYAPFPFQDGYRQVRNLFIDLHGSEVPLDGLTEAVLNPVVTRALAVFPHHDFPEMSDRARSFERVMIPLLKTDVPGLALARELSEAFWFAFCYHLRVHPWGHQNVPEQTIDYWTSSLEVQMAHYENVFSSILLQAARDFPEIRENVAAAKLAAEAEAKRADDLSFIHSFDTELKDLGKFLSATKQLRV